MNTCTFDCGVFCSALTDKKCEGCKFRKSEDELLEGRQKAEKRIMKLPLIKQLHIHRKYYGRSCYRND